MMNNECKCNTKTLNTTITKPQKQRWYIVSVINQNYFSQLFII